MYHQLKEGSGNILGFKIAGGITKKQKERICKVLEKQISDLGGSFSFTVYKGNSR